MCFAIIRLQAKVVKFTNRIIKTTPIVMHTTRESLNSTAWLKNRINLLKQEITLETPVPVESLWVRCAVFYPWGLLSLFCHWVTCYPSLQCKGLNFSPKLINPYYTGASILF